MTILSSSIREKAKRVTSDAEVPGAYFEDWDSIQI